MGPLLSALSNMSRGHEEGQYIPAMKLMWEEVDKRFDPKYILGEAGHQFCQTYAVRAAHAEFPYALHCLSLMCPLVNGARVAIFPTSPSPLTLVAVNVNYAQTRKSSMTGHAESLGQELDAVIFQHVDSRLQQESLDAGVAQEQRQVFFITIGYTRAKTFFKCCKPMKSCKPVIVYMFT